jgi:hypothetical protein
MEPDPNVRAALDRCYDVFSAYPCPTALDAPPDRDPVAILRALTSAPLRELREEDIGHYSGKAITTVGDVDDYKHFLPRILEQAARHNVWLGTEPAVIGGKLDLGDWRTWPLAEQEAISSLFVAVFVQALDEPAEMDLAEDWLCGVATLGQGETRKALSQWAEAHSTYAAMQLASFIFFTIRGERWSSFAFWEHAKPQSVAVIKTWLSSEAPQQILMNAFDSVAPRDLPRLENALDALIVGPPT